MADGNKFFNEKKFNSAKEHDYRCAVKEAMRIVSASGIKFPPHLTQMCAAWDDKEQPWIRPSKECCVKCEGTEGSGPALYCSGCENASFHFHCACNPVVSSDAYWYCDTCCDAHGKKSDVIYSVNGGKTDRADNDDESTGSSEEGDAGEDSDSGDESTVASAAKAKFKKKGVALAKGKASSKGTAKGSKGTGSKGGSDSLQSIGAKDSKGASRSRSGDRGSKQGANKGQNAKQMQMLLSMQQSMGLGPGGLQMMANGMMGMNGVGMGARGMGYGGKTQPGLPGVPQALLPPEGGDVFMDMGSDQEEEEEESTVSIDYCMVCGEGGTLVLCDFPQCPRAYHQACVMPTFPTKLDAHPSNADLDDPWFCPAHHCSMCNVLETTDTDLKYLHLPRHLADKIRYETRRRHSSTNVSDAIDQADLTSCESCPFSICSTCESDFIVANAPSSAAVNYSDGVAPPALSVFKKQSKEILPSFLQQQGGSAKSKEAASLGAKLKEQGSNTSGAQHRYCLNCVSPNPRLAMAKVLEAAWSRAAVTRNALPFFLPLKLASVCMPAPSSKTSAVASGNGVMSAEDGTGTASESESASPKGGKGLADGEEFTAGRASRKRSRDAQATLAGLDTVVPVSLLKVLTKIRSLQYTKKDDFLSDMKSLKLLVEAQTVVGGGSAYRDSMDTASNGDGQALTIPEHVAQTEKEMSGEAYEDAPGNNMTVTAEDKEVLLRALNNMLRLSNVVLRDRQHAVSKLEADVEAQTQRGPRQQRSAASDSDSQPANKRNRPSSSSPHSPSREAVHRLSEDDGVPDPAKSQVGVYAIDSLAAAMEKLWRSECSRLLTSAYKNISNAYPCPISAKHCAEMIADAVASSVTSGPCAVPLQGNIAGDESSKLRDAMQDVVSIHGGTGAESNSSAALVTSGAFQFDSGTTSVGLASPYHEYDYRQFDASEVIYGLRDSKRGETVTLMEDASTYEQWDPTNRINELLATDETLVSLDKLRDMTTKTLHLEARLRKEYLETKNFVRNSGIEKVTIGEVHLIKELKLANDDLRWRIKNKNRAAAALANSVEALQRQLRAKDEELSRQKDELKHLRGEVDQAKLAHMHAK